MYLLSTFQLQLHYLSQLVTLLSATNVSFFVLLLSAGELRHHFSGDGTGHPSGFCSCDTCTIFSPTAGADSSPRLSVHYNDDMSTIVLCRSPRYFAYPTFLSTPCNFSFYAPLLFGIVTSKGHSGLTHVVYSGLTSAIPNFTV